MLERFKAQRPVRVAREEEAQVVAQEAQLLQRLEAVVQILAVEAAVNTVAFTLPQQPQHWQATAALAL